MLWCRPTKSRFSRSSSSVQQGPRSWVCFSWTHPMVPSISQAASVRPCSIRQKPWSLVSRRLHKAPLGILPSCFASFGFRFLALRCLPFDQSTTSWISSSKFLTRTTAIMENMSQHGYMHMQAGDPGAMQAAWLLQ